MSTDKLKEMRKQMLTEMERELHDTWSSDEDSLFYYHFSEDRIVLSHALFWVMTRKMADGRSKMSDVRTALGKALFMFRHYQEEMLDAQMVHGSRFMVKVTENEYELFLLGNEYE